MQRILSLSTVLLALSLHAGQVMALGFGKVSNVTGLGQPLNFSVVVRLDADDALEPGCVHADVVVGDRPLGADTVRARLVRVGASGERRIRVTTTVPIDEPTLSVTVRAGCPARLTRNFVVFADPPHTLPQLSAADAADLDDAPADRPSSSFRAPVDAGAASAPSRTPRAPRRPAAAPASTPAPAAPPVASAPSPAPRKASRPAAPAAPAAPAGRPTLRLDPVEVLSVGEPQLRMATTLTTAPAASGAVAAPVDPDTAQRLRDQAQLKQLEASVRQLREDVARREQTVQSLETRVKAAQGDRYANPLIYLLAGLCALLVLATLVLWWLRRRDRLQAAWWAEMAADAAHGDPAQSASGAALSAPQALSAQAPLYEEDLYPPAAPPAPVAPLAVPVPAPPQEPFPTRAEPLLEPPAADLRRPMSAEELIDLEQQVEFFVVLGQDDAAIDLLMGHVRSTSGVSPLPYLKLLEIYARRDEREPYERIRERFNRRFNAYAPEWGVDAEAGLSVEGYPEVLEQLQGIWQMPSMAMELLDTLLFRRDAGPTFDVPAYRELLFLYGIARDLAERDIPASGVDLLLPFDDDEPVRISPVEASPAPDEPQLDRLTLDLDVSTDQPPTLSVEDPPAYDPARGLDFQVDVDADGTTDVLLPGRRKPGDPQS